MIPSDNADVDAESRRTAMIDQVRRTGNALTIGALLCLGVVLTFANIGLRSLVFPLGVGCIMAPLIWVRYQAYYDRRLFCTACGAFFGSWSGRYVMKHGSCRKCGSATPILPLDAASHRLLRKHSVLTTVVVIAACAVIKTLL